MAVKRRTGLNTNASVLSAFDFTRGGDPEETGGSDIPSAGLAQTESNVKIPDTEAAPGLKKKMSVEDVAQHPDGASTEGQEKKQKKEKVTQTTVYLPGGLLKEAKRYALDHNTTLKEIYANSMLLYLFIGPEFEQVVSSKTEKFAREFLKKALSDYLAQTCPSFE